ncbi:MULTISPECIES: hypothetical protein [unclassified Microcoleus]|uniref:hypothetical protein n=1 Tax=unclassified Microcoleus TaxID=2642155 RepID=UPI002FD238A6
MQAVIKQATEPAIIALISISVALLMMLYRFCLHWNDLTTENTEYTEGENIYLNHSDATGFDVNG